MRRSLLPVGGKCAVLVSRAVVGPSPAPVPAPAKEVVSAGVLSSIIAPARRCSAKVDPRCQGRCTTREFYHHIICTTFIALMLGNLDGAGEVKPRVMRGCYKTTLTRSKDTGNLGKGSML